jgi:cell surface protein SprA
MFKATANVDLFGFKIDLTADRSYSKNFSEQYNVLDGQYYSLSHTYGLFFYFNGSDKTSFSTSDEVSSAAFDDFRANRLIVANRLAAERGIDVNNPSNIDADGYPLDLGK